MVRTSSAARAPQQRARASRRALALPGTAPAPDQGTVDLQKLREALFSKRIPQNEIFRVEYGRQLTLDRIASALRSAQLGFMRDLTDLGSETIGIDPHLASLLQKRFGSIRARGYEVVPVSGEGIDKERAERNANFVRAQIAAIPDFGQAVTDLAWGLWDGRAALEAHWEYRVPQSAAFGLTRPIWWVKELGWIHPRRICFGPERELRIVDAYILTQFTEAGYALRDFPRGKFVDFKPRLFREYPEREGLNPRALYWSFFKRFSQRERMVLLELFGKPWKIVDVEDGYQGDADGKQLEEASEIADSLGSALSARMPKGMKLRVESPDAKGGTIHKDVCQYSDEQLSKLILGNTATTDAKPGALGGNTTEEAANQQDIILSGDAGSVGESFDRCLCKPIIEINFGPAELPYAPTFRIPTEPAKNRDAAQKLMKGLLDMGAPVAIAEAYEVAGCRAPHEDEAVLQIVDGEGNNAGFPVPPRARVVEPKGEVPTDPAAQQAAAPVERPDFQLTPSDVAIIVSVNDGLASLGLPPLTLPDGTPDPDGHISITEYKAKHAGVVGAAAAAEEGVPVAAPPPAVASLAEGLPLPAPDAIPPEAPPPGDPADVAPITTSAPTAAPDDWAIYNGQLSHLVAAINELGMLSAADGLTHFPAKGDNLRPSLKNSKVKVFPVVDAKALRDEHPEVWAQGDTLLGNLQFRRLLPVAERRGVVETDTEEEAVRLREAWASKHCGDTSAADVLAALRWLVVLDCGLDKMRRVIADAKAKHAEKSTRIAHRVSAARQPSTVHGSPETLIARGVAAGAEHTSGWADTLGAAAGRRLTGPAIRKALEAAAKGLDLGPLAKGLERQMLHGAMLGVLDADWEMANAPLKPEAFGADGEPLLLAGQAGFAAKPFSEALSWFKAKDVIPKEAFDKLTAAAKKRAFTIAGLARDEMLTTAKAELASAIESGADLRTFSKALSARFESAGWTPLNPSHTEVVFRNATMGAYSSGRREQMTQPAVLAARPYWQILGPTDDRTRKAHAKAHGKVIAADDPFWEKSALPWGHNCRCRAVSRSEKDLKRLGLSVTSGSDLDGLPDEGWDSPKSLL